MADEADFAFELQSQEINMARAAATRDTAAKTLPATGFCHYCDAHVGDGMKFCDEECAAEWQDEQRLLALSRGPAAAHAGAFGHRAT